MGHVTTASWSQIFIFYYANASLRMRKRNRQRKGKREKIDIFKFCMRIEDDEHENTYINEYLKLLPVVYLVICSLSHPSLFLLLMFLRVKFSICWLQICLNSAWHWHLEIQITFISFSANISLPEELINKMKYFKLVSFEWKIPGHGELFEKGG